MSGDVVTKLSPWPVGETVDRLRAAIDERGLKLFTIVDHSGEAAAAGLELRNTKVVVFGSPAAGTPVMQAAPLAALDLPLRSSSGTTPARPRSASRHPRRSPHATTSATSSHRGSRGSTS